MKQTSIEWYEFNVNVICILIAACTYKFYGVVSTNESINFNTVHLLIFKIS